MNRYFIVFYTYATTDKNVLFGHGNSDIRCSSYPSQAELTKSIMNARPQILKVIISNIIELNEQDFNNWGKKD